MSNRLTRIEIVSDGHCKSKKCRQEYKKSCPVVKTGEKVPGLSQLEFEAKSSKDGAWYDVDTLLSHRTTCSGESEVLVRFAGFGPEDDEWVKVKRHVRERSVPFEYSECSRVKVGNIVLCLQESKDRAMFYDAQVVSIQRKKHDVRGCKCIFLVRYNYDNTEEEVRLKRLCRILVLH